MGPGIVWNKMSLAPVVHLRRLPFTRSDLLAAAVIAVPVLGALSFRTVHYHEPFALLLAPMALAAVLLRDRRPLGALLLAIVVKSVIPDNDALLLPALAVLYTIASRDAWPTPAAAGVAVTLAALLAGIGWGSTTTDHGGVLGTVIGTGASCAAAVALGLYVGARRRVMDGLRERAERLDRERELLADRAVAEERLRIAQELHDAIAHNVSLMVVQAQGLGATVADERVTQTTAAIAELGRQAMAEMHRTLKLLRDDQAEALLTPQPGVAYLDRLLEQSRAAGLHIELSVEGQPRPLAQSVDLSAFRIIQEALTNVIKHAAGARTSVTLSYQERGLKLTITDDGDAAVDRPAPPPAHGHGLIGMRERTSLFGGTLTAQPRSGRGFQVTATLPYTETDP
jgi:signal transduction histidine kinase